MNKTHGSRKQDIERHIIIALFKGDIKRAIDIAQKYNIYSHRISRTNSLDAEIALHLTIKELAIVR